MKGSVIALGKVAGREAAARLVDGVLDDLLIDPTDDRPRPGAILRAICDRPVKGQGGMFVRLSGGGSGYLRAARGLRPGAAVLVQITGHAEPGKATPLTQRVLFKSRYAIVTPEAPGINLSRRIRDEETRVRLREIAEAAMVDTGAGAGGTGLILRSQAAGADEDAVADDIAAMRDLSRAVLADRPGDTPELLVDGPAPHDLAWRDWPLPEFFDDAPGSFSRHDIETQIDAMRQPKIPLPSGAFAFIEPTRALVAIDVNTGADTTPAAGLKANIALTRDLPRQLRCRGLGGQVTIDFAPMPKKDRRSLESALKAALRADPIETAFAGWTPLGHAELQRKRERQPLDEVLR